MTAFDDRYTEGEKQRERIRAASVELGLAHQSNGSTPPGMTLAEHIDSIEANALYQTDNAAVTGMLWVHAAALTAQALEQVAQRYRGEI